jgi:tRNA A37 threonylcarbamoyladenosine synthetase subunit TsaC/SUA5/YrdC
VDSAREFPIILPDKQVDMIIDGGYCPPEPTTVIDLSGDSVEIIRHLGLCGVY